MRILVAEDDSATRLLIRRVLGKKGFEVIEATDGVEALELFEASAPDIVITDFQMPRMDGLQLCKRLAVAKGSRFVPIIMLTGGQDPGLLRESLQAGALEFLTKPVQVDELLARVGAIATLAETHNSLAASQEETLDEISIVKHLLERLTSPGLKLLPRGFTMETLQTRRINGDAASYCVGMGGMHLGLLCDATGHGLAAGVSTLPVIDTFQSMAARDIPLESIYQEVNAKLYRLLPTERFACLLMLRLDPETGLLRVLNAGMPDVFLFCRQTGEMRRFPSRNFPAGILAHPDPVEVEDVSIEPGDRIFACSDGLWDLYSPSDLERLIASRSTRDSVEEQHDWLRWMLTRRLKNVEQHDDLTWAIWEAPPPTPLAMEPAPRASREGGREGLSFQFEFDPRIHQVRELVPNILGLLGYNGVSSPVLQRLGILLTEALLNAVDHGLLGLDSSLKARGFEAYEAKRRAALEGFTGGVARCKVTLAYREEDPGSLHHLAVEVEDNGRGFDWRPQLEAETELSLVPHGRGLALIRALAPDLSFNEAGNRMSFSVAC